MKGKIRIVLTIVMGLGILGLGYCFLAIESQSGSVFAKKKEEPKKEREVLPNCCILSADGGELHFLHGKSKYTCTLKEGGNAAAKLAGELADITLLGDVVEQILVKQEVIAAESFTYTSDRENAGSIRIGDEQYPLAAEFEAYDYSRGEAIVPAQLAGYETVRFVVKDGKFVGAIAEKSRVPDIRVVLMNTGFLSHLHETVIVSSGEPIQITLISKSGGEE